TISTRGPAPSLPPRNGGWRDSANSRSRSAASSRYRLVCRRSCFDARRTLMARAMDAATSARGIGTNRCSTLELFGLLMSRAVLGHAGRYICVMRARGAMNERNRDTVDEAVGKADRILAARETLRARSTENLTASRQRIQATRRAIESSRRLLTPANRA